MPSLPRVLAPALGRAAGEHRARVLHARGDSDGHRSAAEVDRRQVVAHLTSCAATVVHVTVAELAAPAKAPALHAAAARKHRARAEPARRDGADAHAAAEVDRVQVVAHLAGLVAEVLGVAGAELAERARAPALQLAVVEHRARVATAVVAGRAGAERESVIGARERADNALQVRSGRSAPAATSRDRDGPSTRAEIDRRKVVAHLAALVAERVRVAEPELAVVVQAPAFDLVGQEQRTSVLPAGRDGRRAHARAEVDERKVVAHLVDIVAIVLRVAVAQLAPRAMAPALDRFIAQHHARVFFASGEGDGHRVRAEVNER